MGDNLTVAVHRCRFVDYDPSAVTALAFPPLPLPTSSKGKKPALFKFGILAVGHANGNIDLCEWTGDSSNKPAPQAWVIRKTISGPYPSKVDSLAFALRDPDSLREDQVPALADLRLFSSGGGSDLLEWDLGRGCLRRTISSNGGSIWSFAINPTSTMIALGCEDGTVRTIRIEDDVLVHHRRFDKVKCRILSIAWGPPKLKEKRAAATTSSDSEEDDEDDEWEDSWIVTGGSDSALRKWDATTGRVVDRMGTDKIKGEQTLVWAVGVLGNGTIVSGDSMGLVKFWDPRTCTQNHSFRGHDADVLCLTIGPEGTSVYTSGVDQKVTQFTHVKKPNQPAHWVQSHSRRLHSHDVRAIAIWPPHTSLPPSHKRPFAIEVAPVLVSGGLDMSVITTPAALAPGTSLVKIINPLGTSAEATFEESYQRKLAYPLGPSGNPSICIAQDARLVSCIREASATFWKILPRPTDEDESEKESWQKMLEMEFEVSTNLTSSALSDDGRWFVVSDSYSPKLYQLEMGSRIKPRRVREFGEVIQSALPDRALAGAVTLCFTRDGKKLVMSTVDSHVLVIDLSSSTPVLLRRFDPHVGQATVLRLAASPDGQWLASHDDKGQTHVFNLDSVHHHCVLPTFPNVAQTMAFDPSRPGLLILALANNTLQFYNVETRTFPPWAKDVSTISPRFQLNHDPVLGITFDSDLQAGNRYALFWGSTWLCKIRLEDSVQNKKRRRDPMDDQYGASVKDFKMITSYRPILAVGFMEPGELVVVERPLVDVLSRLPPAYFKHKYGKS